MAWRPIAMRAFYEQSLGTSAFSVTSPMAFMRQVLETRNPIVVERFDFVMGFLLSELKRTPRPPEGGRCVHPERLILVEHDHS